MLKKCEKYINRLFLASSVLYMSYAGDIAINSLWGQPKGEPVRYTCDADTHISKGVLLTLTDPNTVIYAVDDQLPFAGISAEEKLSADPSTTIGVWTKGNFSIKTTDTVAVGNRVSISGANWCRVTAATDYENGEVIGQSGMAAAAGTPEDITVRLSF